jgi:beta-lactamase class A
MTRLSRRHALLGGLTLGGLTLGGLTLGVAAACTPKPVPADPAEPLAGIDDPIGALERRHNAYVGLFAVTLDGGRSISHRGQAAFAMCSTFKGYASARVLQMVELGELVLIRRSSSIRPRSSPTRRGLRPWRAAR